MTEPSQARIGIVVVSHSRQLAAGVVELVEQMASGVRLVAAGGMADGAIGTDATLIADAIGQADTGEGVLVLADLGSAVLSANLALELVDPEVASRTRVVDGFSVVAAIAAGVDASLGRGLDEVERAAGGVRRVAAAGGRSFIAEVRNPVGLHARSASNLVQTAGRFQSEIRLTNLTADAEPVSAKSYSEVVQSGSAFGTFVRISAEGPDQDEAIEALKALADAGFPDFVAGPSAATAAPAAPAAPASIGAASAPPALPHAAASPIPGSIRGVAGAPGIAMGPLWIYRPDGEGRARRSEAGKDPEQAIRDAAMEAEEQLTRLATSVRAHGRDEDAAIFSAQAMLAADERLLARAVSADAESPAAAVEAAFGEAADAQSRLRDETLAARAADFRDVAARIVRILRGEALRLPGAPSIVVAEDLPPSVAEEIPDDLLLGVAIEGGSATSHVVILSRSRGIPAVVGAAGLLDAAERATSAGIDGEAGEVALDPDEAASAELRRRAADLAERRRKAAELRGQRCATADGERVLLVANIGSPDDSARAIAAGAEGVGLFRTEFLFMKRQTPATEDEQVDAYRRVFEAFGPQRPVVVRLADIGGDKAIPYLGLAAEANPFLGVRALRLAYADRALLATQLRAIWRAAGLAGVTPHVMAPMVSTLADATLLAELRDEARSAVASTDAAMPDRMVTGVMVEVPSAALIADRLARQVDFFSIGTNDLTQYALAADRSNPSLSRLQDALHPAVLQLVASTVAGADRAGIPVAVCGELAGDPVGAVVLVALGVDELSADAASLDEVRAALARVTRPGLDELARGVLAAPDASTVRRFATDLLGA